jgi:Asp-tRNA(Asn)/Glu-tRNA(Gln) amidotransferase B subunit
VKRPQKSRLFLKITGTTDDYRIQYDTEAVRKKIASDLKKEVQELKEAFKSKSRKQQKEVELSQDEYFDW